MKLTSDTILITGGAGGIGREIALAFATAGAQVAVVDLNTEKVKAVVDELEGGPHIPLAVDLRPLANHAGLFDAVTAAFGGLDVLVCTAAVLVRRDSVDDVSEADWDLQHDVNLKATFSSTRRQAASSARRAVAGASSISRRRAGGPAASADRSPTVRRKAELSR